MTIRSKVFGCGLALLVAANMFLTAESPAREKRAFQLDEEGMRPAAGVADCTYSVSPDKFLQASARNRRALSETTADIGSKVGGRIRAALSHETTLVAIVRKNFIDDFIFDAMEEDDIPYADLSTDEEFLRRVTVDLTGRVPSPDDVRQFLADASPNKRDGKIDALLASPEFVDRWTMFFGDLLKNTANASSQGFPRYIDGRNAFYNYIKRALQDNKPYNLFAKELIGATGDNFINGEANFIVGGRTAMGPAQDTYDTLAVQISTIFLGINSFDCLLCHSGAGHLNALSLWGSEVTRMQAWKMSAFFSRAQLQQQTVTQTPRVNKYIVSERTTGEYLLNTNSGNRTPRQPDGNVRAVTPEYVFTKALPPTGNYRASLAEMLTADTQFARAAVNYLWAEMMGMGIVDPPDQFDLARQDPNKPPPAPWKLQPSHPALLTALANEFIRSNYDLRHMLSLMARSTTYQLSSRFDGEWNVAYTAYFARKFVRRLDAEEIHDAITKATGLLSNYTVQGFDAPVQWAMQLPDTSEPRSNGQAQTFLNVFLRGNRDTNARSSEGSILQAMNLMNSAFVNTRIHNGNAGSLVNRLIAQKKDDNEVVEELYLSTLSRYPTAAEKAAALKALAVSANLRNSAIEDLQWTLINKVDFIYNY